MDCISLFDMARLELQHRLSQILSLRCTERSTYLLHNELADQVVPGFDKSFVHKSPDIMEKFSDVNQYSRKQLEEEKGSYERIGT